jgi:hypothetical protein
VVGNPDQAVGNPTSRELNCFFKKLGHSGGKCTAGVAGPPSSTGLDGRLSDTSGRRPVKSLRISLASALPLQRLPMFNFRLSRSILSLAAPSAARLSVCADNGQVGR